MARKVGVAHITVSRALRHSPNVSEPLRRRIEKAAEEMGYRPNPAASALSHFRTASKTKPLHAVLAWLNFWMEPEQLRAVPLFEELWQGAVEAAHALGYRLEEFICDDENPPDKLKRILVARGIQGILLPPQRPSIPREKYDFDWSRFAAVRTGQSVTYPLVHRIAPCQATDTLEALSRIRQKGYRRVGHITSPGPREIGLFDAAYLKVRESLPEQDRMPILVLQGWQPTPDVLDTIRKWMERNRPDAILSTEYNIRSLLTASGYRVPEDVAVASTSVSLSDVDAGMAENGREVGSAAVKTLVSLVQRGELGIPETRYSIQVRSSWQDGSSLPDPR